MIAPTATLPSTAGKSLLSFVARQWGPHRPAPGGWGSQMPSLRHIVATALRFASRAQVGIPCKLTDQVGC